MKLNRPTGATFAPGTFRFVPKGFRDASNVLGIRGGAGGASRVSESGQIAWAK